jgi:ParB/RepB/Spo0J family partition protein
METVIADSATLSIRMLALTSITPSETSVQGRRRQRYDAKALNELAENIKAVQVIEPIIVRPKGEGSEHFELIAGERRWRASQLAHVETIPAIVRPLNDQAVLEIQLVENLHREGLHELEEAEGYEELMRHHRYTLETLASTVGRSRSYVQSRLRLLSLGNAARDAFYKGKLTAATALLVARIPVAELQAQALKEITAQNWRGEPMSYREARQHVEQRYMTRLKGAPFDQKLENLIEDAGACASCPKRTGNQPELFGDIKGGDVCTDPKCFASKRDAYGRQSLAAAKAEGRIVLSAEEAKRIAPHGARFALQGGYIALDERCHEDAKARTFREILGKGYKSETVLRIADTGEMLEIAKRTDIADTLKAKGISADRRQSTSQADRERQKAAKQETEFRGRLLEAIRLKTPKALESADLKLVASALWRQLGHDAQIRLVILWGWADKKKAASAVYQLGPRIAKLAGNELLRFVLDCALVGEVRSSAWDSSRPVGLLDAAKRLRIDVEAIRKSIHAGGKREKASTARKPAKSRAQVTT